MNDPRIFKMDMTVRRRYTEKDLEEVVRMNRPPIKETETVADPKPLITDPKEVLQGIHLYKDLYKNKAVAVPSFDYEVGDSMKCAKQMMLTAYVSRAPEHLGEPVGLPPFDDEESISLKIRVPLDEKYGKRCNVIISSGHPIRRILMLKTSDTVLTSEKEMNLEIQLNRMVRECRRYGPLCLQFVIQGTYLKSETDEEDDQTEGHFFCKRIEVWSKDSGYNISSPCLVKCWAQNSVDIIRSVKDPLLYTLLFDPPNDWMKQNPSRIDSLVEIEISVSHMNSPPPDALYDYNTNPLANRFYESYGEINKRISDEVEKSYTGRLIETANVLHCTTIIYEPKCGKQCYVDVECIICGKKFMSLSELLAHMYMFYPKMAVTLQRIGLRECRLILSFTDLDITTLGRTDIQFCRDPPENRKHDFLEIMLRAQCVTGIFDDYEEFLKKQSVAFKQTLVKGVMCHLCRMSPVDYTLYLTQRQEFITTSTALQNPSYKCFYFLLFSFLAKRHTFGLDKLSAYMTCRLFLHCHQVLLGDDFFEFRIHFDRFLQYECCKILRCEPMESQLMTDVGMRGRNSKYSLVSRAGQWFFYSLWYEDYSQGGPEYDFIRNMVKDPIPNTNEKRLEVVKKCLSDPFTKDYTCVALLDNTMRDNHDQEFFIPKCMYFGAVATKEDHELLKTFYNK